MGNCVSEVDKSGVAAELAQKLEALVPATKELISFLWAVDTVDTALPDGLYSKQLLLEACRRYETLWLPLLASASDAEAGGPSRADLTPPLDVAWVWFLHRLNPEVHRQDIQKAFGTLDGFMPSARPKSGVPRALPHLGQSDEEFHTSIAATKTLWESRYSSEPYSPAYFAESEPSKIPAVAFQWRSQFRRNIIGSAERHSILIYNEFTPYTLTNIGKSLLRYAKFIITGKETLHLRRNKVPLFDVMLTWHAHLACSADYKRDMAEQGFPDGLMKHTDDVDLNVGDFVQHVKDVEFTAGWYGSFFKGEEYEISPLVGLKWFPEGPRALAVGPAEVPPWPVRPYRPDWGFSRIVAPESYKYDAPAMGMETVGPAAWARDPFGAFIEPPADPPKAYPPGKSVSGTPYAQRKAPADRTWSKGYAFFCSSGKWRYDARRDPQLDGQMPAYASTAAPGTAGDAARDAAAKLAGNLVAKLIGHEKGGAAEAGGEAIPMPDPSALSPVKDPKEVRSALKDATKSMREIAASLETLAPIFESLCPMGTVAAEKKQDPPAINSGAACAKLKALKELHDSLATYYVAQGRAQAGLEILDQCASSMLERIIVVHPESGGV